MRAHKTLLQMSAAQENQAHANWKLGISRVRVMTGIGLISFVISLITNWVDPDKSIILACALGVNFGIMAGCLVLLYERGLLLSPAMPFLFNIPYYSFGNIGALAPVDSWIEGNPGSLDYYPIAGLLASIGLLAYVWFFFRLVGPGEGPGDSVHGAPVRVRLRDLHIGVFGIVVLSILSLLVLGYLSGKYAFVGGYFRDISSQLDKFLAGMMYSFVFLIALMGVRGVMSQQRRATRLVSMLAVLLAVIFQVSMRSRTTMLFLVCCLAAAQLTLYRKKTFHILVVGACTGVALFVAGTIVKMESVAGKTFSLLDNLNAIATTEGNSAIDATRSSVTMELNRRLAGLEMPATILRSYANGASPLLGQGFVEAAIGSLPFSMRPEGDYSERTALYENFYQYGMLYSDIYGVTLSTGLAEFGYFGVVPVYITLAAWHALMWRMARRTPLLYLSYLGHIPALLSIDLLWDGIFDSLRLWLLIYGVLWLLQAVVLRGIRWRQPLRAASHHPSVTEA